MSFQRSFAGFRDGSLQPKCEGVVSAIELRADTLWRDKKAYARPKAK